MAWTNSSVVGRDDVLAVGVERRGARDAEAGSVVDVLVDVCGCFRTAHVCVVLRRVEPELLGEGAEQVDLGILGIIPLRLGVVRAIVHVLELALPGGVDEPPAESLWDAGLPPRSVL